jgi:uncharacterized membrane protein HdeD (DUF308 family)
MKKTTTENKKSGKKVVKLLLSPTAIACMLLIAGIALIAFPLDIIGILLRTIGALILIVELFRLVSIFISNTFATRLFAFMFTDMPAIIAALILLISPIDAIRLIFIIFGAYLIITAVIALLKRGFAGARKRAYIVPLITLALGIILAFFPSDVTRFTMVLIGGSAVFKACDILICEHLKKRSSAKPENNDPLVNREYRDISDDNTPIE